jgi:hypothetical protein
VGRRAPSAVALALCISNTLRRATCCALALALPSPPDTRTLCPTPPPRSEAVRCLFGYRVDMQAAAPGSTKGALVALRPDGAAAKAAAPPGDRDPQLQFRFTPATGRLELLPTPLARALAKEVSTFIERFASVPAFTANLTMDLFQKAAAATGG